MNSPPLRCGIIGTGRFAPSHAQAIEQLPDLLLAAVFDEDRECAKTFAASRACTAFPDLSSLLREGNLDLAAVVTPDRTHGTIAAAVLQSPHAPRLLLIEKPLCTSAEELQALASAARGRSTHIVVNHSRRFNAGFLRLRQRIRSGEWGAEVLAAHWLYYAGWFRNGVHVVDTLRMLLGELTLEDVQKTRPGRTPEDALLDVTLASREHPRASVRLEGIPEQPYQRFEGEILLSKGRIRIQWDDVFIDRLAEGYGGMPRLVFSEHATVEPPEAALRTLYSSCVAFLLRGDRRVLDLAGYDAAHGTMEILLAARSLARQ